MKYVDISTYMCIMDDMNLNDLILLRDHLWNLRWEGVRHNRSNDGLYSHPAYNTWIHMLDRCYNPKSTAFPLYGGRGITVCERWLSLANFISDMGYIPHLTLDRKDSELGYSPDNCRWATAKQQANNKRPEEKRLASLRLTKLMQSTHTKRNIVPVHCFTCN